MKLNIDWRQPSTQRGVAILGAGLLQIFGQDISIDSVQTAVGALMTVAGAIGIFRRDPPPAPTLDPPPLTDDRWNRDP